MSVLPCLLDTSLGVSSPQRNELCLEAEAAAGERAGRTIDGGEGKKAKGITWDSLPQS